MFTRFIRLEFRSFFRSPQFATGLAMKIGMAFLYCYIAFLFFGGAFGLYFGAREEGKDPIKLFCSFFLIYWFLDLAVKFFMQQLPTQNIKPLLTQNISKNLIAKYTLAKVLVSFFTWVFLLFMLPFCFLLVFHGQYSGAGVAALFVGCTSLIFVNAFANLLLNKKEFLPYVFFGISLALGGLHYFKVIDVLQISSAFFYSFFQNPAWALLPLALVVLTGYFGLKFVKTNLYLDRGLEVKRSVGKTENIAFLNRYGATGTFINNDIRLIKRSKAARGAAIAGVLFLFYGALYFAQGYQNSFMQLFLGIFVSGGFMFIFGQRVPAWDSSYYPLMMTQQVPYKQYLKAKWSLLVLATFVSMILAIGYALISWDFYFTIFAAGLYNLGVNAFLTLLAGAYNKKPIDLNVTSKGFTSGQQNFNLKLLLILIPQMLVPMAVFGGMKLLFGMTPAVISLGVLGLAGFFLRDKIFDKIVKVYKSEKYSTIAAFKKID